MPPADWCREKLRKRRVHGTHSWYVGIRKYWPLIGGQPVTWPKYRSSVLSTLSVSLSGQIRCCDRVPLHSTSILSEITSLTQQEHCPVSDRINRSLNYIYNKCSVSTGCKSTENKNKLVRYLYENNLYGAICVDKPGGNYLLWIPSELTLQTGVSGCYSTENQIGACMTVPRLDLILKSIFGHFGTTCPIAGKDGACSGLPK